MTQKIFTKHDKNRLYLARNQFFFGVTLKLMQRLMIKSWTDHLAQNGPIFSMFGNFFCDIYPDFLPDNLKTDFRNLLFWDSTPLSDIPPFLCLIVQLNVFSSYPISPQTSKRGRDNNAPKIMHIIKTMIIEYLHEKYFFAPKEDQFCL